MEHYVTLFDSLFLPQGMALQKSMERCVNSYTLWVLCVDDETYNTLKMLSLSNVQLLNLSELESYELRQAKKERTKGEYCWTLTPFAPKFVFESDQTIKRVTYLDADLWFRKNPELIFREFDESGKNILITDHSYAPAYDQSSTSGQYCVQFIIFNREGGEIVRQWWEDRCIEWCYAKVEDGKFGDQKYLDIWPAIFSTDVHILKNKELVLAPWNATRYPYGNSVIWHFHGARLLKRRNKISFQFGSYPLPMVTRKYVYHVYIEDLRDVIQELKKVDFIVQSQVYRSFWGEIKTFLIHIRNIIVEYRSTGDVRL
jgi:hypothetical protein